MLRSCRVLALALAVAACDGPLASLDAAPELPTCAPPLEPVVDRLAVAPRSIATVMVEGGSGRYVFRLTSPGETGSRLDRASGVFVAGDVSGTEIVRVEDERCAGAATVRIEVTSALSLLPASAELAPGSTIDFEVAGGAGSVSFELVRSGSGGTVSSSGRYVAGAAAGDDVVRATDLESGQSASASVRVRPGAGLVLPVPHVALPVGSALRLTPRGGSGYVTTTSSRPSVVSVEGARLEALAPGDAEILLRDRYTGAEAPLRVSAIAPRTAPSLRTGDRSELNAMVSGDFDLDGRRDLAVAMPGSGEGAYRAGAVFLYPGDRRGEVMNRPARTITGVRREDALGSALALADLSGDGLGDLVIGAWQDDSVGSNAGAVYVHRGATGLYFERDPWLTLYGVSGSDRFGIAVATCDFDGDGDLDLAVGAADDEDNARMPVNSQEGAVHVFFSRGGLFLDRADTILFGAVPDGMGGFRSHTNLRFGSALAAGDFDGDGRCDLAVQSQRPDPSVSNDGAVSLHLGEAAEAGLDAGSIVAEPSLIVAAVAEGDRGSRLGAFLTMADLDGDERADLVLGAPYHDRPAAGGEPAVTDLGAVYVVRGRPLAGSASAFTPAASADLVLEGSGSSALMGHGIAVGDLDGDGRDELVLAQSRANVMDSERSRPGLVSVHATVAGSLPSSMPRSTIVGVGDDERFGNGLAILDGALAILAPYADAGGLDVGLLYASDGTVTASVPLPGRASGRRLGQSVALVGDLTGDGRDDLVVGAPRQPGPSGAARGFDYGAVYVYAGDGASFPDAPSGVIEGYVLSPSAAHSEADWLGEVVADAGDFDGDGRDDLAVVARFEEQPASYDPALWTVEPGCDVARNNPGLVLVYTPTGDGIPAQPSVAFFGPQADRTIQQVVGGFDFNGDGLGDLAVGGPNWLDRGGAERRGGLGVVFGRTRGATGRVLCAPDVWVEGAALNDELGASAVGLGDLDGDGCDELAIGVPKLDRTGSTDEGGVRVVFGAGGASCPSTPRSVLLMPFDRTSWAGTALAALDADGDGRRDLAVGAPRYAGPDGEVGRVYLLSGARIRDQLGAAAAISFAAVSAPGTWYLDGGGPGERLGGSLAAIGSDALAMGGLYANLGGTPNAGGVRVAEVGASGFGAARAWVAGETLTGYPELGASLSARGGALAVGATWGSGDVHEEGTAYVIRLD